MNCAANSLNQLDTLSTGHGYKMTHRVLVVDDDRDVATVVTELLIGEGYQVTTLHDGQQALDHLGRNSIDLIISDIRMPVMDGLTLTALVRETGRSTPIILMSAHEHQESASRFVNVTFLKKPVDVDHIIDAIFAALNEPPRQTDRF